MLFTADYYCIFGDGLASFRSWFSEGGPVRGLDGGGIGVAGFPVDVVIFEAVLVGTPLLFYIMLFYEFYCGGIFVLRVFF